MPYLDRKYTKNNELGVLHWGPFCSLHRARGQLLAWALPAKHYLRPARGISSCFGGGACRPLSRYEVRKKKKAAACIDEIAELVMEKFTEKLGANKQAWRVQVRQVQCASQAGPWSHRV